MVYWSNIGTSHFEPNLNQALMMSGLIAEDTSYLSEYKFLVEKPGDIDGMKMRVSGHASSQV